MQIIDKQIHEYIVFRKYWPWGACKGLQVNICMCCWSSSRKSELKVENWVFSGNRDHIKKGATIEPRSEEDTTGAKVMASQENNVKGIQWRCNLKETQMMKKNEKLPKHTLLMYSLLIVWNYYRNLKKKQVLPTLSWALDCLAQVTSLIVMASDSNRTTSLVSKENPTLWEAAFNTLSVRGKIELWLELLIVTELTGVNREFIKLLTFKHWENKMYKI